MHTQIMLPLPTALCPLCSGSNQCTPAKAGSLDAACWCSKASVSRDALARVPAHLVNTACLCPRCAAELGETEGSSLAAGTSPD